MAAERIGRVLGCPVAWQPVSLGAIFKLTGRSSWAVGDEGRRTEGMAEVQRRAGAYGLPPVRWPEPWPSNYLLAMRAATFAAREGHAREFALSALRLAFREGRDLALAENVWLAASRAGIDRERLQEAVGGEEVKQALRHATDAALAAGVRGVPTLEVGTELFWGDDRLEEAARRAA